MDTLAVAASSQWFCTLLDTAADVYFRYALGPSRRGFAYLSPSVAALTGHPPADFYADATLVKRLVAPADRRRLYRLARSRRSVVVRLHLMRDEVRIPVDVKTVALVRHGRVAAIEGVARLAAAGAASGSPRAAAPNIVVDEPVQRRLAALMFEVHDLLHHAFGVESGARPPLGAGASAAAPPRAVRSTGPVLVCADLVLDADRLVATESGRPVALTTREVLLLRYLLERRSRIVTRQQLLTDVWSYSYTGDDRTVDVHVSRLRRKLPSLRGRLTAIRHIGYRLDDGEMDQVRAVRS